MTEQGGLGVGMMAADTMVAGTGAAEKQAADTRASSVVGGRPNGAAPPRRHAAETRRLYASDCAAFAAWCRRQGHTALPATPATLATYLASLAAPSARVLAASSQDPAQLIAQGGGGQAPWPEAPRAEAPKATADRVGGTRSLGLGALARCVAAIGDWHQQHGHPAPGADPCVRSLLHDVRARRRAAKAAASVNAGAPATPIRRRQPPRPTQLARMAAACPGDLAGQRDRAMLLLAASGLSNEALLALDREHIQLGTTGAITLTLPVGVAGMAAACRSLIPTGQINHCPVRALLDWLRTTDTQFGPVFRKVDRWGNVEHRRLGADALRRIWRRRAAAAARHRPAGKTAS